MKICKQQDSIVHTHNPACSVKEYPLGLDSLNMAITTISGRYPDEGFVQNTVVHEMAYILEGSGSITTLSATTHFEAGDMIVLDPNEPYYWQGACKAVIACNPAFTPDQHVAADS